MSQGVKGWAIWGVAQLAVTYAIKLLIKLADNAVMGWGDDRLAELFGITSPNASTAFNWVLPFVLAAAALWLFHHFTTRPLKDALANQSGGDRFSATGIVGTVSETSTRTWTQRVEPSHIIILGLVISAIGVAWQLYRGKELAPSVAQNTAPTSIYPPPSVVIPLAQEPPTIPTVIYTERDIRELLDALADANNLVESGFSPTIYAITNATANWRGAIPNIGVPTLIINLKSMREGLQKFVWQPLNKFVYETHSGYKDQLRTALALDHEAARGELTRSLQVAIEALERLPDNPPPKTWELVAPQMAEAYKQAELLSNWLGEARSRIASMRDNLRTKGRTGFEKS